jgi:hypothetical protein
LTRLAESVDPDDRFALPLQPRCPDSYGAKHQGLHGHAGSLPADAMASAAAGRDSGPRTKEHEKTFNGMKGHLWKHGGLFSFVNPIHNILIFTTYEKANIPSFNCFGANYIFEGPNL